MKISARKILIALYSPDMSSRSIIEYDVLAALVKPISRGGFRSIMKYLQDQHLVETTLVGRTGWARITNSGAKALERQIPALSPTRRDWDGRWCGVAFLEAPKADPHFRFLRQQLLDSGAFQLRRGVYLFPGELPASVEHECQQSYELSVSIFRIDSWLQGDPSRLLFTSDVSHSVINSSSGISKEVRQMLSKNVCWSSATDTQKQHICSVFNRIVSLLESDYGLAHTVFPQVKSSAQVLFDFQRILSSS